MNSLFKNYLLLLLLSSLCSANVVAAIASLKGDVKIRETDSSKYSSAYKGQMIQNGNWIKTGDNVFLSIIFLDGTNVKIHQKGRLLSVSELINEVTGDNLNPNVFLEYLKTKYRKIYRLD